MVSNYFILKEQAPSWPVVVDAISFGYHAAWGFHHGDMYITMTKNKKRTDLYMSIETAKEFATNLLERIKEVEDERANSKEK